MTTTAVAFIAARMKAVVRFAAIYSGQLTGEVKRELTRLKDAGVVISVKRLEDTVPVENCTAWEIQAITSSDAVDLCEACRTTLGLFAPGAVRERHELTNQSVWEAFEGYFGAFKESGTMNSG